MLAAKRPDSCALSTFTGTHVWEIQDEDVVRCHFCQKKASPERAEQTLADRDYLNKTNRLAAGLRGITDDKKNAAITLKNRRKK